ncbi:MAG: hypothetical protein APF77_19625 [Clostridia bacterium BRH_c25]|nr:MAG: hypothetical protein APF77_19625 [Clostridia bacterium BRH_c25]
MFRVFLIGARTGNRSHTDFTWNNTAILLCSILSQYLLFYFDPEYFFVLVYFDIIKETSETEGVFI